MICENCEIENNENYGSGRFCSEKCARGFSTKEKRQEINQKVSKKLKGKYIPANKRKILPLDFGKKVSAGLIAMYNRQIVGIPFEKLGRIIRWRIIFEQQNSCCAMCKNPFIWLGEALSPQMHHKDGDRNNVLRENLELICPNCHTITKNWGFKNRKINEATKILRRQQAIDRGFGTQTGFWKRLKNQ